MSHWVDLFSVALPLAGLGMGLRAAYLRLVSCLPALYGRGRNW